MKRLFAFLLTLVFAVALRAQTPVAPISGMAVNQFGQPIANAQIRVCEVTSTGQPCTPLATTYLDYGLTIPAANPYTADQYGNYTVYVGQGTPVNLYVVQVSTGSGQPVFSYVLNGPPSTGTGTVTGVSAGSLAPLFTTSVLNPSTTPQISFALSNAPNATFFGNFSGASAAPAYWTLAAGTNVGFALNQGTKTLTLSATGGGAVLPAVNQVISGDGSGNGVGMPEKGTTLVTGTPNTATVAWSEDYRNGIFDCRNPKYAGGCLGGTQGLAMQAFRDQLICYQAMTGLHATAILPPGTIFVGTPTYPTLDLPDGTIIQGGGGGWGYGGASTVLHATYNNHPAFQVDPNITSSSLCSDGIAHTSTLTNGSIDGVSEQGCALGGCVNVPGDNGSYPAGGPSQQGIIINQLDGSIGQKAGVYANANGADGVTCGGRDSHCFHLGGSANNQYFLWGMDQPGQQYVFSSTECHGSVNYVGLDNVNIGPAETYGGFYSPGAEYHHVAGVCWGGGTTNLGPVFSQIDEIGVIHAAGGNKFGRMWGARIEASRGDGIYETGSGRNTYFGNEITSPCMVNPATDYIVYSVVTATPGSGQTPGTYLLSASSGPAQISVTVSPSGVVSTNPTITIPGRNYTSTPPTFTLAAGGTPATFTVTMQNYQYDPGVSGFSSNHCDHFEDQAASNAFVGNLFNYDSFFGTSYATGDYFACPSCGFATWAGNRGNDPQRNVQFDAAPPKDGGSSVTGQAIVRTYGYPGSGGSVVTGTVINIGSQTNHVRMANTSATTLTNISGGILGDELQIIGDGFTTLPYSSFLSGNNSFYVTTCSGQNLLLNYGQLYTLTLEVTTTVFNSPHWSERCDSINQQVWDVGWAPYPNNLPPLEQQATLDVLGTGAVHAVPVLAPFGGQQGGTPGPNGVASVNTYVYRVWVTGGVMVSPQSATFNTCLPLPGFINNPCFQNVIFSLPAGWTRYQLYRNTATDSIATAGLILDVTAPNGKPQPGGQASWEDTRVAPINGTTIPSTWFSANETGTWNWDFTGIPQSTSWPGVPGQTKLDATNNVLWVCTADDTWKSISLGGAGGGIGGSGTVGTIPIFVTNPTTLGNSPLSVASGILTSTDPLQVNDGTGNGGTFNGTEGTLPAPLAGSDLLVSVSANHRFEASLNGNPYQVIPLTSTTPATAGDCWVVGSSGFDLQDAGSVDCSGAASHTPTLIADAGAGTGPTVTLQAGSSDLSGWVNVTTGTTPAASSGVVTIQYGGTYASARKCEVQPSNAAAANFGGTIYVPQTTTTAPQVVINVGATPLAGSTGYQWFYRCGL